MKPASLLIAIGITVALVACATPTGRTEITTFHQWTSPANNRKSFELVRLAAQKDSLEHANYEAALRQVLLDDGFVETLPARYRVTLEYSVTQRDASAPRGGPAIGLGGIFGGGLGVSIGVPIGGIGGIGGNNNAPTFARTVKLMIDDAQIAGSQRVWESTGQNVGPTPALTEVMPAMIRAILTDFPGISGTTRSIEITEPTSATGTTRKDP